LKAFRFLAPLAIVLLSGCGKGPVGETSNIEIRALNMSLAGLAKQLKTTYMDTYSILLTQQGGPLIFFYMPDGEHLSELGYLRWVDAELAPYIKANKVTCVGMVGDSITRRTYVALVDNGTKEATWADLLGIPAYNMGVDGETSADVIKRLDMVIHPDIDCYFLMIGNNDLHAGIPIPEIVANVQTIVDYLHANSGKPVVIQAVMPLYTP
jgi:lysophospholipase L1-like esterase